MGSYQTKNEEIVIAQQGANNLRQVGDMERKIESYGIAIIVVCITVTLLCFCVCGKSCCTKTKKWMRKELANLGPTGQATGSSSSPCQC